MLKKDYNSKILIFFNLNSNFKKNVKIFLNTIVFVGLLKKLPNIKLQIINCVSRKFLLLKSPFHYKKSKSTLSNSKVKFCISFKSKINEPFFLNNQKIGNVSPLILDRLSFEKKTLI